MAVFYQTYRPQKFTEVLGQEVIVKTLSQAVALGRLGHAYLFTGGRGIGKTTLARIVAKAANCNLLKQGDPCGDCGHCVAIARGVFLDCVEIDAASHTGVDNIREIIERIQFQPSIGRSKVFIIDEVHMLSKPAFNALLKTLEEPPAHAMFILATTDIEKVPETIISRTQRFDFRQITPAQITLALKDIANKESLTLSDEVLEVIVENSQGGLRDALTQLSMVAVLGSNPTMSDVHLLLGTTPRASIEQLLSLIIKGVTQDIPAFFAQQTALNFDANAFCRKVLLVLQELLETSLIANNAKTSQALNTPQILYIIRLFLRAHKEVERYTNPELPILLASIEASLYLHSNTTITAPAKVTLEHQQVLGINSVPDNLCSSPQKSVLTKAVDGPMVLQYGELETALNIDQVKNWWPELIDEVRSVNSPIATILKNSPIQEVVANRVSVGVRYLFHKESLENTKNRALISSFLSNKAGGRVEFRVVILKNRQVDEKIMDTAGAVSSALKVFGGELVD